ncbi:MAG: recombination mediator RecR [Rhodospirillales bacterium]
MQDAAIDRLIQQLAKLPGLGPRSARRAVLHLIKRRDTLFNPLIRALTDVADGIRTCGVCGNVGTHDPCHVCADARRDPGLICVVEDVADLWALERTAAYRGRYHVLGGLLSAIDGVGPDELGLARLAERAAAEEVSEVILALSVTVDGQTTAHVIADKLADSGVRVTALAHGVPVGGELDYLDEGTLSTALNARRGV